jgi:hypothetical protein
MAKRETLIRREFVGVDLGDIRRSTRLLRIVEALAASPTSSLPELFGDGAELEAGYRLLNNEAVTLPKVIAPHIRETVERCRDQDIIAAHDTTVFKYAPGSKRRGLGMHRDTPEFRAHVTLAVTADGKRDPLGVLDCETWVRDGRADGSEQRRWLEQVERVCEVPGIDKARVIHVMDREADDYAMFVALKGMEARFVVRMAIDRRLSTARGAEKLRSAMTRLPIIATREVPISARSKERTPAQQKRFPERNARMASLEITAETFTLPRPRSQDASLPATCQLNVVRVAERSAPGDQAPIEWILYTSEPIDTDAQVLAVVDAYRARWRIEEFFKAVKTGCAYEKRQLESYESLTTALGISLPIAWRLLRMRTAADESPDAPATTLLDHAEVAVLRAKSPKANLGKAPTLAAALLAIAALGGHLKRNGAPGWQTLYRGFKRLEALADGYRLATEKPRRNAKRDQS